MYVYVYRVCNIVHERFFEYVLVYVCSTHMARSSSLELRYFVSIIKDVSAFRVCLGVHVLPMPEKTRGAILYAYF